MAAFVSDGWSFNDSPNPLRKIMFKRRKTVVMSQVAEAAPASADHVEDRDDNIEPVKLPVK